MHQSADGLFCVRLAHRITSFLRKCSMTDGSEAIGAVCLISAAAKMANLQTFHGQQLGGCASGAQSEPVRYEETEPGMPSNSGIPSGN